MNTPTIFNENLTNFIDRGRAEAKATAAAVRIVDQLWTHSSTRLAARQLACRGRRRDAYLPVRNYAALTAPEVMRRMEALSPNQLRTVQAYERTHQNRKALLVQVDRLLAARG